MPTRSNLDPRARVGLSERDEIGATVARPRLLHRAEMPVDTADLARFLIGKMLVRILAEGVAGGRIVETEAYGIGDPAGHAYRGITPRNRALFLERGHAYVYLAYGSSFMLNVSSETCGLSCQLRKSDRLISFGLQLRLFQHSIVFDQNSIIFHHYDNRDNKRRYRHSKSPDDNDKLPKFSVAFLTLV